MENIKDIARHIAEVLTHCTFDDVTSSSGYYIIRQFPDGTDRAVDVYKSSNGGTQRYVVYCSYENDDFDYLYTDDLSVDQLENKLKEFYMA